MIGIGERPGLERAVVSGIHAEDHDRAVIFQLPLDRFRQVGVHDNIRGLEVRRVDLAPQGGQIADAARGDDHEQQDHDQRDQKTAGTPAPALRSGTAGRALTARLIILSFIMAASCGTAGASSCRPRLVIITVSAVLCGSLSSAAAVLVDPDIFVGILVPAVVTVLIRIVVVIPPASAGIGVVIIVRFPASAGCSAVFFIIVIIRLAAAAHCSAAALVVIGSAHCQSSGGNVRS